MSDFNKLLVAVDFSDISNEAFVTAANLARDLDASLHVVHIVHIHSVNIPEGGMVNIEELQQQEEDDAKEKLAAYLKEHGEGLDIGSTICSGDPAERINDTAKDLGVDMIVMGTHGRTGLSHLIMGSVAESVLRKSDVPVLCVKHT